MTPALAAHPTLRRHKI
jgi:aminopeptidase N